MKNIYEVLEISLVNFSEDIVTESAPGTFKGEEHIFGNPNSKIFGENE